METMSAKDVRERFSEAISRVAFAHEQLRITRHGKVVAALISYEDLKTYHRLLQEHEDRIDIQDARRALEENEFRDLSDVERDLS